MTKEDYYAKVYDILVKHTGASNDGSDKKTFVSHLCEGDDYFEYRFRGKLGFGGKFRRNDCNSQKHYVTCYSEGSHA